MLGALPLGGGPCLAVRQRVRQLTLGRQRLIAMSARSAPARTRHG
jgi:hypothetical protein